MDIAAFRQVWYSKGNAVYAVQTLSFAQSSPPDTGLYSIICMYCIYMHPHVVVVVCCCCLLVCKLVISESRTKIHYLLTVPKELYIYNNYLKQDQKILRVFRVSFYGRRNQINFKIKKTVTFVATLCTSKKSYEILHFSSISTAVLHTKNMQQLRPYNL